ncbi:hypothetical protein CLOBY_22570 [Clostridium saccharobutylicum]|uniref:Uncharacterized protein n=1 Tax=Clostridium saccharobutylicum DSM 13864 TaxID=1345695 RepID=U5MRM3_CLOSA|nr:hypothetical protein CLSA_c22850 [Clostridium saccharobutylicum DSM 13864]AQR90560.1 hypothetical protein CLOSC_22810 [Clostridium saccharobutylicum]AQS00464.1 hypothetical protein CSACC_22880 [Clostridium saccharobutylicum]AQS10114.1 hypothetical protein CLOBY_22570 [Clostridium saccharobutylicum]AQS14447.1 hypothetical protein CLOSACC_22880 [Clostridium saccharobutylicum]
MIGIGIKGVRELGNIIKINMYVKMKRRNSGVLRLQTIEETIFKYKSWLKENNIDDKIENYEEFIQAIL